MENTPATSGSVPFRMGSIVYRVFGLSGELLYVGVTDDLFGRMAGHRTAAAAGRSHWWRQATRVDWERYDNRREADRAEGATILREHPRYNVAGICPGCEICQPPEPEDTRTPDERAIDAHRVLSLGDRV